MKDAFFLFCLVIPTKFQMKIMKVRAGNKTIDFQLAQKSRVTAIHFNIAFHFFFHLQYY